MEKELLNVMMDNSQLLVNQNVMIALRVITAHINMLYSLRNAHQALIL